MNPTQPRAQAQQTFIPVYSPWRHGGWYVHNVKYPSGAIGCVSRNYPDKKWRIVCHPWPFEAQPTFKSRDDAALAEHEMTTKARLLDAAPDLLAALRPLLFEVEQILISTKHFPECAVKQSRRCAVEQAQAAIARAEGAK